MPRIPPKPEENKPKDMVDCLNIGAMGHLGCFFPIIHTRFGCRAFRNYWISFLIMIIYSAFADCPEILYYIPVWICLIVYRRLTADPKKYSLDQGDNWVFGWMTNQYVARIAEVFIYFGVGAYLSTISGPLSDFVLAAMVSSLVVLTTERATLSARRIARRDAEIMSRAYNENY